jgi:hypothetical protein
MFDQVYEFIGFLLEGQYYAKIIKDMSSYYRILPKSLKASTDDLLDFINDRYSSWGFHRFLVDYIAKLRRYVQGLSSSIEI